MSFAEGIVLLAKWGIIGIGVLVLLGILLLLFLSWIYNRDIKQDKDLINSPGIVNPNEKSDKLYDLGVDYAIELKPENSPYRVEITQKAWLRMIYLVKNHDREMGGHLVVKKIDDDKLIVEDIYVPEQETSSVSYLPSTKEIALMAKTNPELIPKIKGWFHSHADMGAFWSGDDTQTARNSMNTFGEFCISIVMNKKYEYLIRLDVEEGTYDELPLNILLEHEPELEQRCILELKTKVDKKVSIFKRISTYISDNFGDTEPKKKIVKKKRRGKKNGLQKSNRIVQSKKA